MVVLRCSGEARFGVDCAVGHQNLALYFEESASLENH
jgi:hypothetical protein